MCMYVYIHSHTYISWDIIIYMHTHIRVCSHMYCVVYLDSGNTTNDMILRRQRPGWNFNLKIHICG